MVSNVQWQLKIVDQVYNIFIVKLIKYIKFNTSKTNIRGILLILIVDVFCLFLIKPRKQVNVKANVHTTITYL